MRTATILMILDEPRDLQIYGTALRSLGHKVVLCGSHLEGIGFIETESVDYVIVSQGTPPFEGQGVLQRILQLRPKLPVLVIAGMLDVDYYFEAMEMGAVDYLVRPEPRDLLWTVGTHLQN